jgi:hypothetical protein
MLENMKDFTPLIPSALDSSWHVEPSQRNTPALVRFAVSLCAIHYIQGIDIQPADEEL